MDYLEKQQVFRLTRDFLRKHRNDAFENLPWDELFKEFSQNRIPEIPARMVIASLIMRQESQLHRGGIRILHQMERDLVSQGAYGLLVDCISLGLVSAVDSETLLEDAANRSTLPISQETLENCLIRNLFSSENLPGNGLPS